MYTHRQPSSHSVTWASNVGILDPASETASAESDVTEFADVSFLINGDMTLGDCGSWLAGGRQGAGGAVVDAQFYRQVTRQPEGVGEPMNCRQRSRTRPLRLPTVSFFTVVDVEGPEALVGAALDSRDCQRTPHLLRTYSDEETPRSGETSI